MILGFDRRYVFLPVVLSIALVITAIVVVEAGQARLRASAAEVQASGRRLMLMGRFLRVMTDAETGQRGFLLTNEPEYLAPFESAAAEIEPALKDLELAYQEAQSTEGVARVGELRALAAQKLGEMRLTLNYQKEQGQWAAVDLVRTDVGKHTMDRIRKVLQQQQAVEGRTLNGAKEEAERDVLITRGIFIAGSAMNIVLVIVAGLLTTREIRRRLAEGARLAAEKMALEQEVAVRTAELSALSSHLQEVSEREKLALSRELHDELGGLLTAAKMDVSALRKELRAEDPETQSRWNRLLEALDAGVDLKRRVVEKLHPTLLENMGLYAAISWQFQESCGRGGLKCTETLPENELPLSKEAAIAIFRVAQESMTNILKHANATTAHLDISIVDHQMIMNIRDNGVGFPPNRLKTAIGAGWTSMRHRVVGLGGHWNAGPGPDGVGTEIEVRLPLDRIQIAPA